MATVLHKLHSPGGARPGGQADHYGGMWHLKQLRQPRLCAPCLPCWPRYKSINLLIVSDSAMDRDIREDSQCVSVCSAIVCQLLLPSCEREWLRWHLCMGGVCQCPRDRLHRRCRIPGPQRLQLRLEPGTIKAAKCTNPTCHDVLHDDETKSHDSSRSPDEPAAIQIMAPAAQSIWSWCRWAAMRCATSRSTRTPAAAATPAPTPCLRPATTPALSRCAHMQCATNTFPTSKFFLSVSSGGVHGIEHARTCLIV